MTDERDEMIERAWQWSGERFSPLSRTTLEDIADFAIKIRDEALAAYEAKVKEALEKVEALAQTDDGNDERYELVYAGGMQDAIAAVRRHLKEGK